MKSGKVNPGSLSLQSGELEGRLRAERHALVQALVEESSADGKLREDLHERGSPVENEIRELEFNHLHALRRRLRETDEAIGRLKAGTYGTCARCGQPIPTQGAYRRE